VYRLAHRLQAEGVELTRATLMLRALHPQVMGTVNAWTRADDNIRTIELGHADGAEERFLSSPYVPIFAGRGGVRRRLEGPDARIDFPVLEDIRAEGATDYAALPLAFSDGQIHALTLATDAPGGFRTEDLGHIHEILPLLGRLVEVHSLHRTARTLLDTYLGVHTGARVLEGRIRRGDGERIPAVVWMADLRGSTTLQETLDRDVYLDLLNEFFEATAGSAIDAGGEVLKFIGDAVLAIFPIQDEPRAPYQALSAAREALARIDHFNAGPDAANGRLGMALALHIGEVNYGNIGVPGRLDFTATGPVVNEVSRLEGLCKVLGKPVVASGAFAASVDADLVSQGRHDLRGVAEPVEVFTLPELA
jgi:adenylate cyclase